MLAPMQIVRTEDFEAVIRPERSHGLAEFALCVLVAALLSIAVAGGVTLATHRTCGFQNETHQP